LQSPTRNGFPADVMILSLSVRRRVLLRLLVGKYPDQTRTPSVFFSHMRSQSLGADHTFLGELRIMPQVA
jgi:hypothetical protein